GENAGTLVLRLIQELPRCRRDDGMWPRLAQMWCRHHDLQGGLEWAGWMGEEGGNGGEGLVGFGVQNMEDGTDQQRMAGLFPVVPAFKRAFRIDQDVSGVLDVANLPFAPSHFQQGVVGSGCRVSRIEQKHAAIAGAKSRSQRPVLALDVVENGRAGPGEERAHTQPDALAGTRWSEAQHVLWSVVAQICTPIASEHHAVRPEQPGALHLARCRPAG